MTASGPFTDILVGLDAAGRAEHALERGLTWARDRSAKLHVVHAVDLPRVIWIGVTTSQVDEMQADAVTRARERVHALVEVARRHTGFDRATSDELVCYAVGRPSDVILEHMERFEPDLLLLGGHERRDLFDFGSTARAVLTHAKIPVWIQNEAVQPVERIVASVDFSDHSRKALELAVDLARSTGAELQVLHAHVAPAGWHLGIADAMAGPTDLIGAARTSAQEYFDRWIGETDTAGLTVTPAFVEGEPVECILAAAQEADLIVMGTRGHGRLAGFLLGSTAYTVSKRCDRPVLLVPKNDKPTAPKAEDRAEAHLTPTA